MKTQELRLCEVMQMPVINFNKKYYEKLKAKALFSKSLPKQVGLLASGCLVLFIW